MIGRVAVVVVALAVVPAPALAQAPAGGPFQVNTYTTGSQFGAAAAADARGNLVVVWGSVPGYPEPGQIRGQRYEASGARRGAEFSVNTSTTFSAGAPAALASDARGNFVVAWVGAAQDGSGNGIFAQRYDAAGAARGVQFQVNTYTTGDQVSPSIALDGAANFIVVWQGPLEGGGTGVFGQRFDSGGSRLGAELIVTANPGQFSVDPKVASAADGDFVVAWTGPDLHFSGVFARRFDASGTPRGASFQVNATFVGDQAYVALASDPAGHFLVVWRNAPIPIANGLFGQRYDAAGVAQGGEFRLDTSERAAWDPAVAMDTTGGFVVAWASAFAAYLPDEVRVRRFNATGTPRGAELSASIDQQLTRHPALAMDSAGNFTVVWDDYGDVFGRRFGGLHTEGLDVDTTGNHVLEPGEAVDVRPTWVNWTGAPQTFAGTLSSLTGPAGPVGPVYGITDPNGSYGTVAAGLAATCTDCYGVSVSAPTTRPATHWDASVVESLQPDVQGQRKTWLLHVGDSFTDVPRSSGFYRFVEILLHRGVTGGCGAATYCPSSATTREQMAVFVLVAREGAGYTPAACAPPNVFGDVPETSPFCRYIEELAGRGVVSGCGGGNYCPADAVTREQMAVFVLRTLDPSLSPPACTTPVFADVPATSPFCRWVEELARRGVVNGCGGGNYCPADAVSREQMGVFLSVTFGLTLYGV